MNVLSERIKPLVNLKSHKLLDTWSVTSQYNLNFLKKYKLDNNFLINSDIKGLCPIDSYPNTSFINKNNIKLIKQYEKFLVTKPHQSIYIFKTKVSAASVINFRNYEKIKNEINKNSKILEIGAGIGILASIITSFEKNITYYICDLKSTLNLVYIFLKKNFPDIKVNFYAPDQKIYKKSNIILINNNDINKLKENFDIIINIDSFGEMDKLDVDLYFNYASKNLKKNGTFYVNNTHGHANDSYNTPLDYPIKKLFDITKYSFENPTARDNPCKYIILQLKLKNDKPIHKIQKIRKEYNSIYLNEKKNFFYKDFLNIKKLLKKKDIYSKDFSKYIKLIYYSKLYNIKIKNKFDKNNLYQSMLYYFYDEKIFSSIYHKISNQFFRNKCFLTKLKIFYILGKEGALTSKEINFLHLNSKNNLYKKYFLLSLLYLGLFEKFIIYSKKYRLDNDLFFELINTFNYSKLSTVNNFANNFKTKLKKIEPKNLNNLVMSLKLKKITFNQLKIYMNKYHNNYYSFGYLLKNTLFLINNNEKLYFIKKSLKMRSNNLQNINFLYEVLFFSQMFKEANKLYKKFNLKNYFFYSHLKHLFMKNSIKNKLNLDNIFDESTLMINNGTTNFMPFYNTGNNNIIISNN
jgi:putative sugar O-methyltransferase